MVNELSHPADGEAWKHFDRTWPEFEKDARKLDLVLQLMVSTICQYDKLI
jgi:hypothetical protein